MEDAVRAITDLVFTYAELFDAGDFDGFGRLFEHGTFRTAGVTNSEFRGSEAVTKLIRSSVLLYDGIPSTKHAISNVIVHVDGDSADARAYFTLMQALPDFPLQTIMAGRYHDRFEKVDGSWRYTDHEISLDLIGDLSKHIGIPLPD
ncbi:MAG: nuclear transport factor 2 family protein [Actinomycetota bacterium]